MLDDLQQLFDATPTDAQPAAFRHAVVWENVLGKRTNAARESAFANLKALYGLDPNLAVYRIMRQLWQADRNAAPMLALLCALARDPLLRATAPLVLAARFGSVVPRNDFDATVRDTFSASTRASIVSHVLSTWTTSGHLTGFREKVRSCASPTVGSTTYALALGFMQGFRGSLLLATDWCRILDAPADLLTGLVRQADRRGWITYRAAGDVVDVLPDALFLPTERELCNGLAR